MPYAAYPTPTPRSFLSKGEVLAYVGRIHNLKDLKDPKDLRCLTRSTNEIFAIYGSIHNALCGLPHTPHFT